MFAGDGRRHVLPLMAEHRSGQYKPVGFSVPFQPDIIAAPNKIPPVVALAVDRLRQRKGQLFPPRDLRSDTKVVYLSFRLQLRIILLADPDPIHITDAHPPLHGLHLQIVNVFLEKPQLPGFRAGQCPKVRSRSWLRRV